MKAVHADDNDLRNNCRRKEIRKRRFAKVSVGRGENPPFRKTTKRRICRLFDFKRSNMKFTRGCISRRLKLARRIEKRPTKYSAQVDRVVTTKGDRIVPGSQPVAWRQVPFEAIIVPPPQILLFPLCDLASVDI